MIAQLRDVLPARQSTEMAEEDQQNGGTFGKQFRQRNSFAIKRCDSEIWGIFSDLQFHSLSETQRSPYMKSRETTQDAEMNFYAVERLMELGAY